MRKNFLKIPVSIIICMVLLLFSLFSVSALDDTYEIDDLDLSVKIPKEYIVITRTTERDNSAFSTLSLSYNETMTAFQNADIYLQAISEEKLLKIDLTAAKTDNSKKINNYSDMSSAQRREVLNAFLSEKLYTSGVELKHNDIIYFDFRFARSTDAGTVYGYQCHTVVNGMNINLTLQKNAEDLTADEIKIITNIANSIDFENIRQKGDKKLEFWRFLLFVGVLAVVIVLVHVIYKHYHVSEKAENNRKYKLQKSQENMNHTDVILASQQDEKTQKESKKSLLDSLGYGEKYKVKEQTPEDEEVQFDELLGYDTADYRHRANSQIESFDLKVKQKKRTNGVKYFEDDGENIGKESKAPKLNGDYFDNFFNEKTEERSSSARFFSNCGLYIKIGFKRLGYFFTNIWRLIFPSKKLKGKSKKR